MKRLLLAVLTGVLMMYPGAARTSAQSDALGFFKNYFITGDYVVGGVGLNATGQGQITISGVPTQSAETDIVAAYLYWQVVASDQAGVDAGALGATFRGYPLSGVEGAYGKQLGTGSPTCAANGGGTGGPNGSKRNYTYRADVLRFFDIAPPAPLGNGKTVVNGPHAVSLPSNNQIEPLGASLVVIFRDSTRPLSAIVLYDGGYTMNQVNESMSQTLKGFYQSSGASSKLTHIVGSGLANKSEILYFNGAPLATNPFTSALGDRWDNPTFSVATPAGASQATTSVDHQGFNSFDCLTWAAVVYRTTVQDSDDDGLLDVWETSTLGSPLYDPNGQALPALGSMGADPNQKDLFIEIGHMKTDVPTSYGGVQQPAHSHQPPPAALKLMGDALKNAPLGKAINVHFDVGDSYADPLGEAAPYLIRGAGLARGGEAIDESVTVCTPAPGASPWDCQYAAHPGTVGWKSGFRFLRDEVLTPPPAGVDCDLPGSACERRFDRVRLPMFHYALFAHAVGLPVSELPCLDASGQPVEENANDQCTTGVINPQFRIPRTNTGVGDFPGGDILVTLGAFPDVNGLPVGTPFMQASTLLHEFGHNAERRHGGDALEPNCKPTYLSAMNYLYQLRGLPDNFGKPNLNFSSGSVGTPVDETNLVDGVVNNVPYRIGWYARLEDSYLFGRATAAARRCDGSAALPGESFVRIDARTSTGVIDWNANGVVDTTPYALDVNYNGRVNGPPAPGAAMIDSDDWSNLRLNQIGTRRNVGGLVQIPGTSFFAVGPLSLDVGKGDLGKGDLGKGDLGKGDLGKGDLGKGDLGKGDLGKGDLGKGDLGKGDLGGGDLFTGDPNNPGGELDFETAGDLAKTPPNEFRACVIGVDCTGTPAQFHRVRLDWKAPNVGGVASYSIYRVAGATLEIGQTWVPVGSNVPAVLGQTDYSLVDDAQLVNGAPYTYFAVATYGDGVASDPSNLVTIIGVNDPPFADNDAYATDEDTLLSVPAATGVLANDYDPDTVSTISGAVVVTGPAHGTLTLSSDGSFTYLPAANYNGTDTFTYKASDGTTETNVATVTLTVNPVNDAPTAVGDSYSTAEDTALNVAAPGVLGNDTDVDNDALTAVLVSGPAHGTLTLNLDGSFTYSPAANYHGADAFTYKANDGAADSNTVSVALTVTPVNDAPVATGDSYTTAEDTALNVAAPGVLGNDTDVENDALTAVLVSGPAHGSLALQANGSFSYTPAANYHGADSFTYKANDGAADSSTVTVALTVTPVNDAPVATGDSYTTAEDTALNVAAPGVLGNDTDVENDALTAVLVSGPAHGSLVLQANGAFSYTPAANYHGADAFTYKANDGAADSNTVSVALTVTPVNDAPTISDIADRTIDANTNTGAIAFTIGDVDGLTGLTVSGTSSNPALVPAANIVFGGSGAARTVTVTPAANQSGTATIAVTVTDPGGLTAGDTFLLTVRQVNYTFVGVQNIPPPNGKTFKAGQSIPLAWQYQSGATVVDSSTAQFTVTVVGPLPNPTVNDTDSGQSSFRYSNGVWNFNLQTKSSSGASYPIGTYQVTVTSLTPGFPSSAPFTIKLVK